MIFLCLMVSIANADISVSIINNTRLEFDVGREVNPYVANEVTLVSHNFGNILDKNKFRVGIRHKANDYIKIDPHLFIQRQRENDWTFEYGPTLRIDVNF